VGQRSLQSSAEGPIEEGVAAQATDRLSSRLVERGIPGHRFRFHEKEEIGPRMLVRIAMHTGLAPEDL
jgi:hypothetical protein